METLWQDIKYGARMLLHKPGFTVVAVLTLALGIGATTAIFSVVNTVLLQPLPYPDPDRLVRIREYEPSFGTMSTSWLNYADWRDQNTTFDSIASVQGQGYNLSADGTPVRVSGQNVTGNLFSLLGVEPLLGRTFTPEEDQPGGDRVVLLSHHLWQDRFGGNPEILGETLLLDERPYTIIGVMPARFDFRNSNADIWTALGFFADQNDDRGNHPGISTFGRLRPGVTLEQADQDLNAVAQRLAEAFPVSNGGHSVKLQLLQESRVSNAKPMLFILLGAVGFVLLIGCANVANLLLAQATARQKEMALRMALGAGRARLIRQLLTESLLMALLGGTTGILLAYGGLQALKFLLPGNTPRLEQAGLDMGVLGFALGLSLLTGIVFGLAPSLISSNFNLHDSLKEGGRTSSGAGRHHLRHALVVTEVALALVLLIGAGLMIRTISALGSQSPGFNTANLLTLRATLSSLKYPFEERQTRAHFVQELLGRVEALPGVEAAATVYPMPLSGNGWQSVFVTEENPLPPRNDVPWTEIQRVSAGYFRTMEIPLLKGRVFTEQDTLDTLQVVIVDEIFAAKHWPNDDLLGKRIRLGHPGGDNDDEPWRTVVGVAGHIKLYGITGEEGIELYMPQAQSPIRSMQLLVRTSNEPQNLTNAIRQEVLAVDPDQPIYSVQTMEEVASQWVRNRRASMFLLGAFALLALVAILACYIPARRATQVDPMVALRYE